MIQGSQHSYVTTRIGKTLDLKKVSTESMIIKTFGSEKGDHRVCDIVELKMSTMKDVCDPVQRQPITPCQHMYPYLSGHKLANSGDSTTQLQVDVLIGSDHYWSLITGRVMKGPSGPTAVETKLRWVLSGPVEGDELEGTVVNLVTAHCAQSTHSL